STAVDRRTGYGWFAAARFREPVGLNGIVLALPPSARTHRGRQRSTSQSTYWQTEPDARVASLPPMDAAIASPLPDGATPARRNARPAPARRGSRAAEPWNWRQAARWTRAGWAGTRRSPAAPAPRQARLPARGSGARVPAARRRARDRAADWLRPDGRSGCLRAPRRCT